MPTYEYLCDECGFKFEVFQSIAAEPVHICPRCGGQVHRLISGGGGIIFKGSGFYETDYKKRSFSEPTPATHAKKTDTLKENGKMKTTEKTKPKSS